VADLATIRDGVRTQLETLTGLVAVFDNEPDRLVAPAAVVSVESIDYHETPDLTIFNLVITVVAARWEPSAGQDVLDGYLAGSNSIPSAIAADRSLGGAASTSTATRAHSYGMLSVADSNYWGAQIDVEVVA